MKTQEGKQSCIMQVKTFSLKLNDDVSLHNMRPFLVNVCFEYWGPTKAIDFEEPDVPEYLALEKVCTIDDVYLTDARGIMVHISPYGKFLDLLSEAHYDALVDALSLKQEDVCL